MVIKQITEIETDKIDYIRGATIIELLSEKRLLPKRAPNGANNPDNVERAGGQSGCFVRASLSQLSPTRVASNTSEGGENDQE